MGGAELWWWLFMRISGLVLLFLALGHLIVMHLSGTGAERIFDVDAGKYLGEDAEPVPHLGQREETCGAGGPHERRGLRRRDARGWRGRRGKS